MEKVPLNVRQQIPSVVFGEFVVWNGGVGLIPIDGGDVAVRGEDAADGVLGFAAEELERGVVVASSKT